MQLSILPGGCIFLYSVSTSSKTAISYPRTAHLSIEASFLFYRKSAGISSYVKRKKEGVFQRLHFLLDCSCHSKHTHARFHNPLACCRILCINRCRNCNLSRYRFKHTCRFCIRIVYIFRPCRIIKCYRQT